MAHITPRTRLLHLRILALRNASIGYAPHREKIEDMAQRPTKLAMREAEVNALAWRYRRQISPELVPAPAVTP